MWCSGLIRLPWHPVLKKKVCKIVGRVLSPILANIYLHELDCYMAKLISDFSRGKERSRNPEYNSISLRAGRLNKKIEQEENQEIRSKLLDQKKVTQRRMLQIPSVDQQDPEYRRVKYCRYADDFVLGAICPKSEAEAILGCLKLPSEGQFSCP